MITKIRSLDEIVELVKAYRAEGRTIITTNGCFDLLHPGHIRALQESKKQARSSFGSVLIVGIDCDEEVRKRKGPDRPVYNQNERAEIISALGCVDYATIYNFENCIPFVDAIKPDIHTNGPDYGENCIEAETVKRNGGIIYIYKWHDCYSTTKLIERLKNG